MVEGEIHDGNAERQLRHVVEVGRLGVPLIQPRDEIVRCRLWPEAAIDLPQGEHGVAGDLMYRAAVPHPKEPAGLNHTREVSLGTHLYVRLDVAPVAEGGQAERDLIDVDHLHVALGTLLILHPLLVLGGLHRVQLDREADEPAVLPLP